MYTRTVDNRLILVVVVVVIVVEILLNSLRLVASNTHTLTRIHTKTATDIHMIGAFRQTLGIPDDMLPDAWRRTAGDETQQKDFASDQGSHATDDACARNPYRQQKEQEQHQHQHQLQHQNYNQLQHNRNRRVRHIGSSVRGR
jgi:hypothetical protein